MGGRGTTGNDMKFRSFLGNNNIVDVLAQALLFQVQTRLDRVDHMASRQGPDDIPIVQEDTSMEKTIMEMTAKRGVTGVVDEEGRLVGIFVYGDLGRLLEKTKDIFNKNVRDVMIRNPKTITKDKLAAEALKKMEEYGITSLIVNDENRRPIGIVHLHDIMRAGVY